MLKPLLLLQLAVLSVLSASAQFNYSFNASTATYARLTGATSMTNGLVWDEEILSAPIPFTWKINGTHSVNDFFLALEIPGVIADTNNFGSIHGFFLSDVDIADRGQISGTASSPISYQTTGTAPNRIFKVEIANAGFFVEFGDHGSMDDSISMQVWIYETSNIVEYHYGPSKITFPSEYYGFGGTGPVAGYGRAVNVVNGSTGSLYSLTGNGASPSVSSLTLPSSSAPNGLSAWPANGQVYRFTPTGGVGVAPITSTGKPAIQLYPSPASTQLNVKYLADANEAAEYRISSVTGALMSSGQLHSGLQTIDVHAFASGTYYLQVKAKNTSGNYYFVKQ